MENIPTPVAQLCPNPANRKEIHQIPTESHCARVRKYHASDIAPGDTKYQPGFAFPSQYFTRFGKSPSTATNPHWALPELPGVIPHLPAHTCSVPASVCPFLPHTGMVPEGFREFSPLPFKDCSKGFQSTLTTLSWNMASLFPVLSLVGSMTVCGVHPLEKLRDEEEENFTARTTQHKESLFCLK